MAKKKKFKLGQYLGDQQQNVIPPFKSGQMVQVDGEGRVTIVEGSIRPKKKKKREKS